MGSELIKAEIGTGAYEQNSRLETTDVGLNTEPQTTGTKGLMESLTQGFLTPSVFCGSTADRQWAGAKSDSETPSHKWLCICTQNVRPTAAWQHCSQWEQRLKLPNLGQVKKIIDVIEDS